MVNTIKFSQFATADIDNATNQVVGFNNAANFKYPYIISWTTAHRPVNPLNGVLGYNTSLTEYEFYDSVAGGWKQLATGSFTPGVTQVDTGTGLTGGPITSTGTISFASIGAYSLWANNTASPAVPSIIPLAALTRVNDTNVTLTLGGNPLLSLLNPVSLTLGWTGQLNLAKGGTNASLVASLGSLLYSSSTAIAFTAPLTNGQLQIGHTGNAPAVTTLTAGTNVTITNGPGSITIASTGGSGGLTWNEVVSSPQAISNNNAYIASTGSLLTFTLPLTAAQGDLFTIVGKGAGLFRIITGPGQSLSLGDGVTATTSITSKGQTNSVVFVCTTADLVWTLVGGPQGSFDYA